MTSYSSFLVSPSTHNLDGTVTESTIIPAGEYVFSFIATLPRSPPPSMQDNGIDVYVLDAYMRVLDASIGVLIDNAVGFL